MQYPITLFSRNYAGLGPAHCLTDRATERTSRSKVRRVLLAVFGLLFAAVLFGFGAGDVQTRTAARDATPAVSHANDHAGDRGSSTNTGSPVDDDDDDDDSAAADSTECVAMDLPVLGTPASRSVSTAPSTARGLGPASGFANLQERPPRQARG